MVTIRTLIAMKLDATGSRKNDLWKDRIQP
jgi:hypothetical protein